MNQRQKIVAWIGVGAFVLMGVFPPWNVSYSDVRCPTTRPAGYAPIFLPPNPPEEMHSVS